MGPLNRSNVTVSVIMTYAYYLLCLLPYQSMDCVVSTINSACQQWKILGRAKTQTDESVAELLLSCNQEDDRFYVCPPTDTCPIRVSLRKTLSVMSICL